VGKDSFIAKLRESLEPKAEVVEEEAA